MESIDAQAQRYPRAPLQRNKKKNRKEERRKERSLTSGFAGFGDFVNSLHA